MSQYKYQLVTKAILLLLALILFRSTGFSQIESGKWAFGYGAGIDFTDGSPFAFGTKIRTSEGCSSVSNSNGDLLFYTDGVSVWNRKNEIMPNGKGLNGHLSSTQSAIIVPDPEKKTILYIFTMDSEANKGGFCYSIVDLTKEQGFGDIVLKNHQITTHCTEKLVAVRHANNKDIWIIIHEFGSDAFMAYLLTKDGLSTNPVITNIGLKYDKSIYNTIGYMKISSDSKKLAVAINGFQTVQIFDFDSKSGSISKPTTLKFKPDLSPYGIEFSPNSSLLYISIVTKGLIYQANLKAENEQAMQKSLCIVGQSVNKKNVGSLQLGIDGKIYIAEYQSKFLSAIEDPDTLGTRCYFKSNAISLNESICMFGLPTFFQDYVNSNNSKKRIQIFRKDTKIKINTKYILDNVYFDFNQSVLRYKSTEELTHLIDFMTINPKLRIEIIGHTDSIGGWKYNNKLSLARAKEVKNYLTSKGVDVVRVSFTGKGYIEPIASNSEENGRQKNRRVEFYLTDSVKTNNQATNIIRKHKKTRK